MRGKQLQFVSYATNTRYVHFKMLNLLLKQLCGWVWCILLLNILKVFIASYEVMCPDGIFYPDNDRRISCSTGFIPKLHRDVHVTPANRHCNFRIIACTKSCSSSWIWTWKLTLFPYRIHLLQWCYVHYRTPEIDSNGRIIFSMQLQWSLQLLELFESFHLLGISDGKLKQTCSSALQTKLLTCSPLPRAFKKNERNRWKSVKVTPSKKPRPETWHSATFVTFDLSGFSFIETFPLGSCCQEFNF